MFDPVSPGDRSVYDFEVCSTALCGSNKSEPVNTIWRRLALEKAVVVSPAPLSIL